MGNIITLSSKWADPDTPFAQKAMKDLEFTLDHHEPNIDLYRKGSYAVQILSSHPYIPSRRAMCFSVSHLAKARNNWEDFRNGMNTAIPLPSAWPYVAAGALEGAANYFWGGLVAAIPLGLIGIMMGLGAAEDFCIKRFAKRVNTHVEEIYAAAIRDLTLIPIKSDGELYHTLREA